MDIYTLQVDQISPNCWRARAYGSGGIDGYTADRMANNPHDAAMAALSDVRMRECRGCGARLSGMLPFAKHTATCAKARALDDAEGRVPAKITTPLPEVKWRPHTVAPETVLAEAARVVDGPRRDDYGTPSENHGRTAAMWSAYLGVPITARQVCMLNILQKISRDAHAAKRDNLVDIAGYVRNAELVCVGDALAAALLNHEQNLQQPAMPRHAQPEEQADVD